MVDKNTRFVLSIFGMLIAAGLVLLATVLVSQAQDFEPDRRPEEGMKYSLTFRDGSKASSGYLTTTPTSYGAAQVSRSSLVGDRATALYWATQDADFATKPFTASSWSKLTVAKLNENRYILAHGGFYSGNYQGVFAFWRSGYFGSPYVRASVYRQLYSYNPNTFVPLVWQHNAITDDGTTMRVYHDGVQVSSAASLAYYQAAYFYVGSEGTSATSAPSAGECFDGEITGVRILIGRAKTAAEVMSEFQTGPFNAQEQQP